ncbi:MAG: FGGY-family carbohydrate kinase, partial [Candidatus Bathyarchaeia archaeon]
KLTGIICTDPSDASATQLFDVAKNAWSQEISKILDLSMSKLPVIVPSHEIIGKINRGVLKSVPVIAGCADAAADNLAAGVIKGGECLVRLGTCGALFLVQEALPITSEQYYVLSHCVTDLWLTHNLTPAGLALDWFAKLFNLRSYNDIDKLALRAPVGSRGLFFYPYLLGEHTPRVGRPQPGGFVGLSLLHGRSDLARAVLEGIAFSVRECFETLVHTTSQRTGKLIVAGGGARSKIWVRIIADVIGEIVYLPKNFDASFGAALLGGIGAGVFKDVVDAVQKCVTLQSVIPPRRRYSQLYSSVFKDYIFVAELLGRKEMDTRQIL